MNNRYNNMNTFLWAGLIGNINDDFLNCFEPSRTSIKLVNDYASLGSEISGIVGQVDCRTFGMLCTCIFCF